MINPFAPSFCCPLQGSLHQSDSLPASREKYHLKAQLSKEQISDFTKQLNIDELYSYIADVKKSTEEIIRSLTYSDLKLGILDERREKLSSLGVVSTDERAVWLVDYWCKKDVRGLIQMPFSRHWIMHIEACQRIINKL